MDAGSQSIETHATPQSACARPLDGVWVVYDESRHGQARFVARKSYVGKVFLFEADDDLVADNLEALHALLPPGRIDIGRLPDDPPSVVEIWV